MFPEFFSLKDLEGGLFWGLGLGLGIGLELGLGLFYSIFPFPE